MDDASDDKKAKGTKKCIFENYKDCCLIIKLFIDHRKDLKAIIMMRTLKK